MNKLSIVKPRAVAAANSSRNGVQRGVIERRSNAERTAQTQRVLLEAAIDCLFRLGYGATTTHVVAEAAGASRGAMLHHFPTKAELMAATVRYAWEKEFAQMHEEMEKFKAGMTRFKAMIEVHWKIVQCPEDIAINEVRHGARSDAELANAVHPIMVEIAKDYGRFVGEQIKQAGLEPDEDLRGLTVNWTMSMPMMVAYLAADPNSRMEQSLLASLEHLQASLIDKQLKAKNSGASNRRATKSTKKNSSKTRRS